MGKRKGRRPVAQARKLPPAPYGREAHHAIVAELRRVTLGGLPGRPELEV